MTWLVGAVLLAICLVALRGHYNERRQRMYALAIECAEKGHDWDEVQYALDSPWWPYRRCKRCGLQDHLKVCAACGKNIKDGKVCDGD